MLIVKSFKLEIEKTVDPQDTKKEFGESDIRIVQNSLARRRASLRALVANKLVPLPALSQT